MKRILAICIACIIVLNETFAGDYLTNTNQHAAFLRMVARGASVDVDGIYSNPAGLSFLEKDGFYLSITGQSAFQTREINASYKAYKGITPAGPELMDVNEFYKGTASAPIIPSFHGLFKKGRWTISASFAITGGGGKASFDQGLPMFNSLVKAGIFKKSMEESMGKMAIGADKVSISSALEGKQYIYGTQFGFSYKALNWLSVYLGGRMNYVKSGYEGFLDASLNMPGMPDLQDTPLTSIALDCDQSGWGLTPIIGVHTRLGKFDLAAKYEFKTNLNIENQTKKLELPEGIPTSIVKAYADGEQTPNDIPGFLSIAAQYHILPSLRASVEYHFYDDKNAEMLNDRQKTLKHGTHEYLAGVEWDIINKVTVSGGFQKTNYGLSDDFQTDTSFYCDSYSLGVGLRINFTKAVSLDAAYFWTKYKDYTKTTANYNGTGLPGTDVYNRTNKVFGMSLNYQF